jgi:glycosyltransferase involved in cell wall biosynthesis/GT2 family glycosyltransferase
MIDPNNTDFRNTPASTSRPDGRREPLDPSAPPRVTLLTPFFNTGEEFHETAESVFRQTFQQWEWIIVNDCSTEPGSLKILEGYRERNDPRIRVVDLAVNAGPSAARNRGVELAGTEFIYPIDSDDLIEPTTIEKCYWYLVAHPECPWVNGWSVGFGAEEYLWRHGYPNGEQFLEENLVTGRTMMRKSVLLELGGYDESIRHGCEDWALWLKAAESGIWGHTIPEFFDWYRRREHHWSRWQTIRAENSMAEFRAEMKRRFPKIFNGGFPAYEPRWPIPFEEFTDALPAGNTLRKEKPRLLLVVPWLAMGGADKFNLDVVRCLAERGWELTIATTRPSDNPWAHEFQRHTGDIIHLPAVAHASHQPLVLRAILHSRQPDAVLFSGSELGYWLLPYLRHHFPRIPFLDYSHIDEAYWKNGGYPRYSARSQAHLDLSLVTSCYLREWMVAHHGANPETTRVVHINVDPGEWKPDPEARRSIREDMGIDPRLPLILFAGRLCPQKQPEILGRVALELRDRGADFQLLVAGDGENKPWLEGFVKEHRLGDRVRFLGSVPSHRIRRLMQTADIFFLPSLWEGIALSIYEAMAVGMAVVGADVGGQRELVAPGCGILIKRPKDNRNLEARRYVEALEPLLASPEACAQLGLRARERILANFTLDRMADNLLAAIAEAGKLREGAGEEVIKASFAQESAIRAVEYFRLEAVADALWRESRVQRPAFDESPPAPGLTSDPLKDWLHIQRHIPFRMHRWFHAGPVGRLLRPMGLARLACYDDDLDVRTRLEALCRTRYYQRIMALKKHAILRRVLPKAPAPIQGGRETQPNSSP